jgi:hypothetical protein
MATSKTQAGKAQADKAQTSQPQKIAVRNVNHPGAVTRLDAGMYDAMKRALLKVLPKTSPGLTVDEVRGRVMPHLPQDLFPGGAKSGWWLKAVQLDLEARGVIARENTKPLRLHKA